MVTRVADRLPRLDLALIYRYRWHVFWWMVGVTIFNGASLALKKPTLSLGAYAPLNLNPFPVLANDTVTFIVTFTTVTGMLALIFKIPAVAWLGPTLERWLRGSTRTVRLRDAFSPSIRKEAFWGGSLQAAYQMGVVGLVAYLSPSGISAARACVIVPLAILEVRAGLLQPSRYKGWLQLGTSMAFTLGGAGIVVFEGGFKLFKDSSGYGPFIALLVLASVGNFLLAKAEMHEYNGVHDRKAAAPVYSLARIMMYVATCVVVLFVVGVLRGHLDVIWQSVLLCVDRWWLVLPVAIFGAISDTSRICVKTFITATYMYTMLAMAVVVDILLQIPLKYFFPTIYDNVHPGWETVVKTTLGAALLIIGIIMHPRTSKKDLQPVAVAVPA